LSFITGTIVTFKTVKMTKKLSKVSISRYHISVGPFTKLLWQTAYGSHRS